MDQRGFYLIHFVLSSLHTGTFHALYFLCYYFLLNIIYVEICTYSFDVYIFDEKHRNMSHANKDFVLLYFTRSFIYCLTFLFCYVNAHKLAKILCDMLISIEISYSVSA